MWVTYSMIRCSPSRLLYNRGGYELLDHVQKNLTFKNLPISYHTTSRSASVFYGRENTDQDQYSKPLIIPAGRE